MGALPTANGLQLYQQPTVQGPAIQRRQRTPIITRAPGKILPRRTGRDAISSAPDREAFTTIVARRLRRPSC